MEPPERLGPEAFVQPMPGEPLSLLVYCLGDFAHTSTPGQNAYRKRGNVEIGVLAYSVVKLLV